MFFYSFISIFIVLSSEFGGKSMPNQYSKDFFKHETATISLEKIMLCIEYQAFYELDINISIILVKKDGHAVSFSLNINYQITLKDL